MLASRVDKGGGRVSNAAYGSGERRWESNMTFSVAHVSMTVPSLVLFYFTSFSTSSSQHSSNTVAEVVDTVDRDSRFLQLWVDIVIICNWAYGHTPLVYCQECGAVLVISHVTFPMVFTVGICTVRYSPPLYSCLRVYHIWDHISLDVEWSLQWCVTFLLF